MGPAYERTIAVDSVIEIEVRKSRFMCSLVRVGNEQDARIAIDAVRRRHWDANHHCTAWRIGAGGRLQRSNDDGEPAGTAGTPMLEVLHHRDLTDTLAIVTRYFGGTKLGAGGLIRAYGSAVSVAVNAAGVVDRRPRHVIQVAIGHSDSGRIENALRSSPFSLTEVTYNADDVTFTLNVEPEERVPLERWLAEASSGRADLHETGVEFVEVPVPLTGN
ncbi:MAG: YigZ family protein [Thermomicrobiales bacterium]